MKHDFLLPLAAHHKDFPLGNRCELKEKYQPRYGRRHGAYLFCFFLTSGPAQVTSCMYRFNINDELLLGLPNLTIRWDWIYRLMTSGSRNMVKYGLIPVHQGFVLWISYLGLTETLHSVLLKIQILLIECSIIWVKWQGCPYCGLDLFWKFLALGTTQNSYLFMSPYWAVV